MKIQAVGAVQCGHFDVLLVLSFGACVERGPIACEQLVTAYVRVHVERVQY